MKRNTKGQGMGRVKQVKHIIIELRVWKKTEAVDWDVRKTDPLIPYKIELRYQFCKRTSSCS